MISKTFYAGLLALVFTACTGSRQIVLSIDTTAGIPCDIDRIRVVASASRTSTFERDLTGVRLPLTLTLSDETSQDSFALEVTGLKGDVEVLRAEGSLQFGAGDQPEHITLASKCTMDVPCRVPNLTSEGMAPPPVTTRFTCGPEVKQYAFGPTLEPFLDVCVIPGPNVGKVLTDGGGGGPVRIDALADVLPSFGFRYYGQPIHQIWVHKNGYLSFTPTSPDERNEIGPGPLDRNILGQGASPPRQSIMAFWDKLILGPDGVCYALDGSPGTQKLRLTWSNVCHTAGCAEMSKLNFTVVLDERDQRVKLTYGPAEANPGALDPTHGANATVGVVDDAQGCPAGECDAGLCTDGVTACGYTQVFSNVPQPMGVQSVQFDPIIEPK